MTSRTSRPWRLASLLLLLAPLVTIAPAQARGETPASEKVEAPRLVILFAPCTVRKDVLAPYAPEVRYTPHLARFAEKATVFLRHQTETSTSGIAYASLLSGSQADRHSVYSQPAHLPDRLFLISEAFARAGFETHYWAKHVMAAPRLNYAQGVDATRIYERPPRGDDPAFRELLDRLRSQPDARAFVLAIFQVTHRPYDPGFERLDSFCDRFPDRCEGWIGTPREERLRLFELFRENHYLFSRHTDEAVARFGLTESDVETLAAILESSYEAGAAHLDAIFGSLLAAVDEAGLGDESLVAFTADHGEVLHREDLRFSWAHGDLASESLGVPLIIGGRSAGVDGGRYGGVSRSIDVYPTLAALAGVPVPARSQVTGTDLSEVLRHDDPPLELRAFSHTAAAVRPAEESLEEGAERISLISVGFREGDRMWKSPVFGESGCLLFDLEADPLEKRNLCDESNEEHLGALEEMKAYRDHLVAAWKATALATDAVPHDESLEMLRSLGYIGH